MSKVEGSTHIFTPSTDNSTHMKFSPALEVERPPSHPLAHVIADPAAMGLFAFAVTTFVAGTLHAKWYTDVEAGLFACALCYGGIGQLIAGILDLLRGVKVGGSSFMAFGFYWTVQGVWGLPQNSVVDHFERVSELKKTKACFLIGFAFVALSAVLSELKSNIVKIVLLGMVTFDFAALSVVAFTENESFEKFVGWVLIMTAILAWYLGTAHLFEDGAGLFELPIGKIQRENKVDSPV